MKTENFTKINPFSLAHTHFSCLFQAGIYADEGISGTDTKKRDEFNRMMDNCAAGEIDLIITKSISRFARNTVDCLRCIRKLKSQQIAVYFEKENINTLDAKGEVLITIMASLAQQESQSISQNVKMGIHYQFQQGKAPAKLPLILHVTVSPRPPDAADGTIRLYGQCSEMKNIWATYCFRKPIPSTF